MSNFLLHKHRREDLHFKRPDGLNELLSDISREVLREQPECVYSFVADYLEAMLVTREQTLIAERTRNSIFDMAMTVSDMMRQVGVRKEKAIQSANIIEQSFRNTILNDQQDDVLLTRSATVVEAQILEQLVRACGFNANELRKAQKIIQVCFKDFYFREKEFTLKLNRLPYDAWANRVEKTLEIYRQAGPQRWELERAAIAIQSAYRGYYTRKQQRDLVSFNAKATAIQAAFRGHVVRKQLAEERAIQNKPVYQSELSRVSQKLDSSLINETDNLHVDLCPRVTTDSNIAAKMIPRIEITEAETGKLVSPPELDEKLLTPRGWDENKAATKIQALYRGHKVRKYLEQMDDKIVVVEEPDD